MAPFHIKARVLRQAQLEPAAALGAFEPRAGQDDPAADESAPRPKRRWQQSEVKRAIAAAEQAGLESYRVEVSPDGTIAIIVGAPADTAPDPGPYQDFLER